MLGVSTLCFLNMDPQEAVSRLAKTFCLVEVIAEGRVPLSPSHRLPDVTLSFHAPFSDINIASANRKILKASLEELENAIRLTRRFGGRILTIHPGRISPQTIKAPRTLKKIHLESLVRLTDYAERNDVVLALENMPESPVLLGKTPHEIESVMRAVHSKNLRMTLDVGHAGTTGTLMDFVALKRYVANMHLHDNRGEDDHRALGEGTIDFYTFFRRLGSYTGNVILELEKAKGITKSRMMAESLLRLKA